MKAYLITTGSIFAILALLHFWHAIDERGLLETNPGQFVAMVALGALAAGLSVWAFRLLRVRNSS
jgi:hypothetical protein